MTSEQRQELYNKLCTQRGLQFEGADPGVIYMSHGDFEGLECVDLWKAMEKHEICLNVIYSGSNHDITWIPPYVKLWEAAQAKQGKGFVLESNLHAHPDDAVLELLVMIGEKDAQETQKP